MRHVCALSVASILLSLTLSASGPSSIQQAALRDGLTRTVYVSVLNDAGAPVTDLGTADFVIKEGGKDREIVNAGMTSVPLRIALLVDDNGTGIFRYGVAKFIERLQGRAEFAVTTVTGQNLRVVDYTTNIDLLTTAIGRLTARAGHQRRRATSRRQFSKRRRIFRSGAPRGRLSWCLPSAARNTARFRRITCWRNCERAAPRCT